MVSECVVVGRPRALVEPGLPVPRGQAVGQRRHRHVASIGRCITMNERTCSNPSASSSASARPARHRLDVDVARHVRRQARERLAGAGHPSPDDLACRCRAAGDPVARRPAATSARRGSRSRARMPSRTRRGRPSSVNAPTESSDTSAVGSANVEWTNSSNVVSAGSPSAARQSRSSAYAAGASARLSGRDLDRGPARAVPVSGRSPCRCR